MSQKKKRSVRAIVRVVLEIESGSAWGDDFTFQQITEQAESGVKNMLTSGNELALKGLHRRIVSIETCGAKVYPIE